MQYVVIQREPSTSHGTFGIMYTQGITIAETLELPWKNNQKKTSCIPAGEYQCIPHNGAHFTNVWELLDVPGRDAILIHAANTIDDLLGCIGVGSYRGELEGKPAILKSQAKLIELRNTLPKKFMLRIENA